MSQTFETGVGMGFYPSEDEAKLDAEAEKERRIPHLSPEEKREAARHDEQRDISLTGGDDLLGVPQQDPQHREHEPRSADVNAANNPWTQPPRETDT